MPLGLHRFQQTGHSHFVTFSCYRRQPNFRDPKACDLFLLTLESMRRRFNLQVYGYVVMPEHIHLLLSEPRTKTLADAIHYLKLSSSKRLRATPSRPTVAAFWQKRYYDFNLRNYRQFIEKLRYIHRNPVKRGLCAEPADWKWSSFRHYARREQLAVEIESEWTAQDREDQQRGPRPGSRVFLFPG